MKTTLKKIEEVKVGETVMKEGFSWLVDSTESYRPSSGTIRTILTCHWDGHGRNPVAFKNTLSIGCKNGLEIPVQVVGTKEGDKPAASPQGDQTVLESTN